MFVSVDHRSIIQVQCRDSGQLLGSVDAVYVISLKASSSTALLSFINIAFERGRAIVNSLW